MYKRKLAPLVGYTCKLAWMAFHRIIFHQHIYTISRHESNCCTGLKMKCHVIWTSYIHYLDVHWMLGQWTIILPVFTIIVDIFMYVNEFLWPYLQSQAVRFAVYVWHRNQTTGRHTQSLLVCLLPPSPIAVSGKREAQRWSHQFRSLMHIRATQMITPWSYHCDAFIWNISPESHETERLMWHSLVFTFPWHRSNAHLTCILIKILQNRDMVSITF